MIAAVVRDTRLTPEAARVVLDVAVRGPGAHEIPHSHFAALLNHPGERRLRETLKLAVEFGYLDRSPGGKGHSDRYKFTPAAEADLSDSPAPSAELKDSPAPVAPTYTDRAAPSAELKTDSPAPSAELNGPRGGTIGGGRPPRRRGGGRPPTEEKGGELDSKAAEAIEEHEDLLRGCRGALRDYLVEYVEPQRQYTYVHGVACYLTDQQPVFRWPDGTRVEDDIRPGFLATALNELPDREPHMKAPVGSLGNLRTKLDICLRQAWEAERGENPFRSSGRRRTRPGGGEDGGTFTEDGYDVEKLQAELR